MLLIYHDTPYDEVLLDRIVLKDVDTSTLFEEISKGKTVYAASNYMNFKQFPGVWLAWNDPEIKTIRSAMILCEDDQSIRYVPKLFIVHTNTLEDTPLSIRHSYLKNLYIPAAEDYSNGNNPTKP